MKVSDYIMQFLHEQKVNHIFTLTGGGIMYLLDALAHSTIKHICCHHEQAAGIAAQAYAMQKNSLGVCLVTTGPGGTNALTAAGAAYVDSTPVLFISGQVKTSDFASLRNVRQFGAQENDIISMVKSVTKYAVTVQKPEEIRYHLEKAVYLAMCGRRGPVWLDIPLDIQSADILVEEIKRFDTNEIIEPDILSQHDPDGHRIESIVMKTITLLKECKRPLFLIGHGLNASEAEDIFYDLEKILNIPVVTTWRALNIMDYDNPLFFGSPGLQANRYSNLITQGADLIIVLGSRLDNMITAFDESHFAFRAKAKIIVDIDKFEIEKLNMENIIFAECDIKYFLDVLYNYAKLEVFPKYVEWLSFCREMKERFPLMKEKQDIVEDMVNLYEVSMTISEYCDKTDSIVVSSTSRCNTAGHMAFKHKKGQKTISSMGFGSMGFALPSVVGTWFANNKKRIIMLEGDGSLQLNIQELQTIVYHCINAKLFIFNNSGYAAIATMQDRNFNGFHIGCDEISGVSMPDLKKIAEAYGISYYSIKENGEIRDIVERVMEERKAVICEFFGSIKYDEIPKCISTLNEEGKRISAVLENPYPFMTEEDINKIYEGF